MPRQSPTTFPISKNVCVFCATRLQPASPRPQATLHRRFFGSSTAAQESAADATVQRLGDQKHGGRWKSEISRNQSPGKWAQDPVSLDLTPEEQDLRNSLMKAPQELKIGKYGSRGRRMNLNYPTSSDEWGRGRFSPKSMQQTSVDASPSRLRLVGVKHAHEDLATQSATRDRRRWICGSCGFSNSFVNEHCMKCHSSRPQLRLENGEEAERVAGWEHVRRRVSPKSGREGQDAQTNVSMSNDNLMQANAAKQDSLARMERTKDGKFVGLSGRSQAFQSSHAGHQPEKPADFLEARVYSSPNFKLTIGSTRGQPSPSRMLDRNDQPGNKSNKALDGWEYPVNTPAAAEVFSRLGEPLDTLLIDEGIDAEQEIVNPTYREESQGEDENERLVPYSPTAIHSSSNDAYALEESREPKSPRVREPKLESTGHASQATTMTTNQTRHKVRKSKKFVSDIDSFDEEDEDEYMNRRSERRKQREKSKLSQRATAPPTPVYLPEFISVSNLAGVLRVRVEDFLYKMQELGFEETKNDHVLDAETAGLVAAEFNFEPIIERSKDEDLVALPAPDDKSNLPPRPPVVTIMGHVDHGKTTLLDFLRQSSVAASEHGGITQHIGAFSVKMPGGRLVTFLDTPGHEAFLTMRQRGANVTDIVILVVAADDSVKPQTVEAIKHAQAAKVPMIVAVNKIDKEDSNVERVKQDLARYGVEIEDYGGDTQIVYVSGKTGQGMEELEDAAVTLADILDTRSVIDGQVEGWVLEATTKKSGRVATILVRRGILKPGDVIVAGTSWARVRSLRNEAGVMVSSAGPGIPVEIDGWREQPAAGDEVIQAPDEQKAKAVIDYRQEASNRKKMAADMDAVNETRRLEQEKREQLEKAAELGEANPEQPQDTSATTPNSQEIFFIVKADVSGSVEAVTDSVSALGNSEIRPHILRSGVGPITEFDLEHAAVANGHIINFNTVIEGHIHRAAETKGVDIIDQSIIYKLVDDVRSKLSEKLPSITTQRVLGEAEIAQIFEINTKRRTTAPVAGCKVRNGVIAKTAKIRVLRGRETIFTGTLSTLKNVKKDVQEMRKGNECGMSFENWSDFKVGDQVQAFEEVVEKRSL